jgi:AbrB family looped-hinge helix DNA binding protein
MATKVTVKGQVTLPKSVREAAGIRPGDSVEVRHLTSGGILIERQVDRNAVETVRQRLQDIARRQPMRDGPLGGMTSEEIMRLLRGDE